MSDFGLPFDDPPEPAVPTSSASAPASSPSSPARRTRRRVFTVTELTATIRNVLESEYPQIWIEGEISNARVWNTGHLYFILKDKSAQLKAVMFRSSVRYLRFKPADGQQVLARGRVTVYDPKGEYQIVCEHLEPHGIGARQLAYEQLRERLAFEGLFDDERKRPLPILPRQIGIVTSLDGAAIQDILKVLNRRWPNAHVVISPARVQGDEAPAELVHAINRLGRRDGVDVIIVTRGGGSVEDLWSFNHEGVARAIATAPVPIISAVGHESDTTICDFVADLRAPTPSAAAELVVARHDDFTTHIHRAEERLRAAARVGIQHRREHVHRVDRRPGLAGWPARLAVRSRQTSEAGHHLSAAMTTMLAQRTQRTHALGLRLEALDVGRRISRAQTRLTAARFQLRQALTNTRDRQARRVAALTARLDALSPLAVLSRGYAVCWTDDGKTVVRTSTAVAPGASVQVTLHRGELECEVRRVRD